MHSSFIENQAVSMEDVRVNIQIINITRKRNCELEISTNV